MKSNAKANKLLHLIAAIQALKLGSKSVNITEPIRLPLGKVHFNPSEAFRLSVYKLSVLTKMSPAEIFKLLLEIAAGMDVKPVEVRPQNGSGTGVSLDLVAKALQAVADCVRIFEAKETLADEKVQAMREGQLACIELQRAVCKLCAETFYSHETLVSMEAFASKNNEAIKKLISEIETKKKSVAEPGEKQKEKEESVARMERALEDRKELKTVLVRLGFAAEYDL